jgi:hypothetical protein
MAIITTILTPEARHTPFTGGTDQERLLRGSARGVTSFFESTASNWPATGVGDNRSLTLSVSLDRDYAYVMTDMSAAFIKTSSSVMNMEAVGFYEIKIPVPGGSDYAYAPIVSYPSRQDGAGSNDIGNVDSNAYNSQYPILDTSSPAIMVFQAQDIPNYMLYPFDNTNNTVDLSFVFSESVANQTAYTCRFAARFIQYDISQAYDWRVQSPTLTR